MIIFITIELWCRYKGMLSHIVEVVMNSAYCFYCVQAVEFEGTSVEGSCEVAVAGVVFLLDLEVCWFSWAVVHVVGVIDRVSNIESMSGVVRIASFGMELGSFLIPGVLGIRVDSFFIESLFDDFIFDQSLCSFEILHGSYDFWVGGNGIFFEVGEFWSLIALHPRCSILLVAGVVKCTLGGSGEGVFPWFIHGCFIYNLNNMDT